MNDLQMNLLGTAGLRRKQRKLRFYIIFAYSAVWLFSLFALLNTVKINLFMAQLYRREIQKVQNELDLLKPKLMVIEKLYAERQAIDQKINIYCQSLHRPLVWQRKLLALSGALPGNIRLEEISINTLPPKGRPAERLKLVGYMPINPRAQDLTSIEQFKLNLEKNAAFMQYFQSLELLQNRIGKKGAGQALVFTLGAY